MEGALRASEPQLTSMYVIFSRLNADEPIGTEQLARKRLRWFQPGTVMYAIVLIPVMFAAVAIGALLGGGARSTTTCEASYSVGGVSPLYGRPSCPVSGKPKTGVRPSRFTTLTRNDQAFLPAARVRATAVGPAQIPGTC
jgi:hypothetical protein